MRRAFNSNAAAATATALVAGFRAISTRGQYNPLHRFDVSHEPNRAHSFEQFRAMTANPGPLRVAYSVDYLDWYYRAYSEKVKHAKERQKRLEKYPGGAPTTDGRLPRLKASAARTEGEREREACQTAIDRCAVQHGLYDLYERQPQFPAIHIDRCTDHHVRELLRTMFFEGATSASELWELALLHRAMLLERRVSYPESFGYIFDAAEATHFAEPQPEQRSEFLSPTAADQSYYAYMVRKYHVENAAEVHVVLRCLDHPDAAQLLLSIPPPKEDEKDVPVPQRPKAFPPLDAMLRAENLNLARCLIFGELNTVADVDPFAKFPNALGHVTRPVGENLAAARSAGVGMAHAITERRGKLFAPLSQAQQTAAETRGRDAQRMQTQAAARDANFQRDIDKMADEMPHAFQADNAVFNPRAIRADLRDVTSRSMLRHLRRYEAARDKTLRPPILTMDSARRSRAVLGESSIAPTCPTVAHFSALILNDKHVSFAASTATPADSMQLLNAAADAARLFFKLSIEYHVQLNRKVNKQKLLIALSLLDSIVAEVLQRSPLTAEVARLGTYTPWASRQLDEAGYPTPARFDDYRRWMAAAEHKSTPST